jgi:hypothetical protein
MERGIGLLTVAPLLTLVLPTAASVNPYFPSHVPR